MALDQLSDLLLGEPERALEQLAVCIEYELNHGLSDFISHPRFT